MKLYRVKIAPIAHEVIQTLNDTGLIEVDPEKRAEAELDLVAIMEEYLRRDSALREATLRLCRRPVEFHRYAGTGHWFFESDRPPAHDAAAAELAWERTIDFLRRHVPSGESSPG